MIGQTSGQDGGILFGTSCCVPQKNISESHVINPLLIKLVRSRQLVIGFLQFFFFALGGARLCLGPYTCKKELSQYLSILTSRLVNNPHVHTLVCSDLTEKLLVFWKTGHWGETVTTSGTSVIYKNRYTLKEEVTYSASPFQSGSKNISG